VYRRLNCLPVSACLHCTLALLYCICGLKIILTLEFAGIWCIVWWWCNVHQMMVHNHSLLLMESLQLVCIVLSNAHIGFSLPGYKPVIEAVRVCRYLSTELCRQLVVLIYHRCIYCDAKVAFTAYNPLQVSCIVRPKLWIHEGKSHCLDMTKYSIIPILIAVGCPRGW